MSPIALRTPPTRDDIKRRCAQLLSQRNDLDPTGAAYEACSMQLDDALSALWALGPREVWPVTDP
jgi:hypothetical protein